MCTKKNTTVNKICRSQEVTPVFLKHLKAHDSIRSSFYISDATGTTLRGKELQYGVVMCVHKVLCLQSWALYVVPSLMNRRPLVARIILEGGEQLSVATAHLESMEHVHTRIEQLNFIFKQLQSGIDTVKGKSNPVLKDGNEGHHHAFLLGDCNFDADANALESRAIPSGYKDAWLVTHADKKKQEESFTVLDLKQRIDQVRFCSSRYMPVRMERIGTDPIPGVKIEGITDEKSRAQGHTADEFERPSDHFGLYVQFDRRINI
mmetsp:Transcript_10115/g.18420  ORF Transcript_10115/g.18420 Transcript_10115/m.18420 type:complete len:263 (-) Transcript_10115:45-833(-)